MFTLRTQTTHHNDNAQSVNDGPIRVSDLLFTASSDIQSLKSAWRAFEMRAAGHVFQTYGWVSNWHTHVGTRHNIEPFIVTASTMDGRMRMLLPFGIQTRRGLRVLVWLGGDQADYKGPLVDRALLASLDEGEARGLVDMAIGLAPNIDAVQLTDMQAEMDGFASPFASLPHQLNPVAAHHVTLDDDWDAFYEQRRSASHRRQDRKKRRKLGEEGGEPIEMKIARTRAERAKAIAALIDYKRKRLAEIGVGDIFADPGVRAFYRTLADEDPITCQLSVFEAGGKTISANWGLVWGGRYYYVMFGMTDGPLRRHSPGKLHLHELIKWSIDRGLKVFDFTAGDEDYKDTWCNGTEELIDVYLGLTMKGRAFARAKSLMIRAKRTIKKDPRLWAAAFTLRCTLHKLRTYRLVTPAVQG